MSWLTHMNSREPSFFAYKFMVPEPQKLYLAEIDYPDDAFRTYAIAVRDSVPADYPIAGGVDTGHEYPLTNGMLTHSLLFRPNSTDLRLLVANARDGVRAAAAKIRIYRVEGDALPPLLPTPDEGRGFANWYEEGSNFAGMYGADRRKGLPEYLRPPTAGRRRWRSSARIRCGRHWRSTSSDFIRAPTTAASPLRPPPTSPK